MTIKARASGAQWGFDFALGDINDRVRVVLSSQRNGWTFNQEMGAELRQYIRQPNTTQTTELIIGAIEDALDRAGIQLEDLQITPTRTGGRLMIRLVHSRGTITMEA